ncbi:MAG: RHS repeat-associated core domain-containing protein [Kiritimatiellae bacterium]|nr:RHS repeat-associated core domain-containing protein [Kiritimatiellia bacterium]
MLDMVIHSEVFGGCANDFDALERVVSSVDSHTSPRQWLYNRRSELVGASGTQANPYDYAYSYDSTGNRLTSSDDFGTATYAANCLNQYTVVNRTIEQLVLRSLNEGGSNNSSVEHFGGNDLSGSEQSAGGVGCLLATRIDGVFYVPVYGSNGSIMMYVGGNGWIAAQYDYDPYGNILQATGPLAQQFAFGFSTKYHDREVGLVAYQLRTYNPTHGRWLNRDPIGERGGENLYVFCGNQPIYYIDAFGLDFKGEFISAIQILGGLCTIAGGLSFGAGTSWTGVGGAVGLGIVALGLDQFAAGLQNLQRAVNNEKN